MLRCELYCCFAGDVLLCHPTLLRNEVYRQQAPVSYTGLKKDACKTSSSAADEEGVEEGHEDVLPQDKSSSSLSALGSTSSSLLDLLWRIAIGAEVSTKKLQSTCLVVLVKLLILHLTEESRELKTDQPGEDSTSDGGKSLKKKDEGDGKENKVPGGGGGEEEEETSASLSGHAADDGEAKKKKKNEDAKDGEEEKATRKEEQRERQLEDLTDVLSYRLSSLLEIVYLQPALQSPARHIMSYVSEPCAAFVVSFFICRHTCRHTDIYLYI